jgi:ligand-binding SRPBCC domain-containing protein
VPGALEKLIPPWEEVQVAQPPSSLAPGTRVVLRTRLGPLWTEWEAEHTRYEKDVLFEDVQRRGPFARWVHTHRFLPAPGGTLLRDEVEYRLPLGPLGQLAAGWLVEARLQRMFRYRHQVTKAACEAP